MCVLSKTISALQIVADKQGKLRTGILTQLNPEARVEICGAGFNDRTIKVRSGQELYFVFRKDLPLPERIRSAQPHFG